MAKISFKTSSENRDFLKNAVSIGSKLEEVIDVFSSIPTKKGKDKGVMVVASVNKTLKDFIKIKSKMLNITSSEYIRRAIDYSRGN